MRNDRVFKMGPSHTLSQLSVAAVLAATVACSEPPTAPLADPAVPTASLDAEAGWAVRVVLEDASGRLMDAIEDAALRGQLSRALVALQRQLDAGQLGPAEAATVEARIMLTKAAARDSGSSMSADLEAIDLALGVVAEQLVRTREQSAGGER